MREMIIMSDWLRNLARHLANDIVSVWHKTLDLYLDHALYIAIGIFGFPLVYFLFFPQYLERIPARLAGDMATLSLCLIVLHPFAMRIQNRR